MAIVDDPPTPNLHGEQPKSAEQTEGQRRTARIAGWFFVVTFVTSIPALFLYRPLLKHTHYILGSGARTGIALGATLEVFLAISSIATAVVLYPFSSAKVRASASVMSRVARSSQPSSSSASSACCLW